MAGFSDSLEDLIDAAIRRQIEDDSDFRWNGQWWFSADESESALKVFAHRGGSAPESSNGIDVVSPDEPAVGGASPASIFEKWETRVYDLFGDFEDLPAPGDFDTSPLESAQAVLAVNPEVAGEEDGEGEGLGFDVEGNMEFTKIESASTTLGDMQGATADAFRRFFLDPFPLVTQRQYGICQMLHAAVQGEINIWRAMETDVPNLISEATNAMSTRSSAGTDWGVVGAIAGIAGLVPGFGQVAGGVGAVAGLFGAFPEPEPKKTSFELSGGSADATWSDVEQAAEDLKEAVREQESTIADHLSKIANRVSAHPDVFDLSKIDDDEDKGNESEADEFGTETDGANVIYPGVRLNFPVIDAAGDDLIDVSSEFRKAAGLLDGAIPAAPWSRPSGIGDGALGHFSETDRLKDDLVEILLNTQQALRRGGEVVQIAAKRLKDKDYDVEAELERHKNRVDRMERKENGPPAQPPSHYPPGLVG